MFFSLIIHYPDRIIIVNTKDMMFSWSPEGSHLITSRGVSATKHVAVILPRGKWEPPQDLVGHQKPIVSVVWIYHLN